MARKKDNEKKIYVLDTNILLHEPFAFLNFQEHDVIIPMTVLEELDHIKYRNKDVSRDARVAIRALEDVLKDASPDQMLQGVAIPRQSEQNQGGHLFIINDHHISDEIPGLPGGENDHLIINTALYLQREKSPTKVILVTKDINMRLKAKGAGLKLVEDYRTDQLIDDVRFLYKGYYVFSGEFWRQVGECRSENAGRSTYHYVSCSLLPNAYVNEYLIDEAESFAGKVVSITETEICIQDFGYEQLMHRQAWGIRPKNIYQAMAMQALLDPHLDLVILTGPAGCGKTLIALAAALELVIEKGM